MCYLVIQIKNINGLKHTSTPATLKAAVKLAAETKSATNNIFMLNNAKQYQPNIYTIKKKAWKTPLNEIRWSLYFLKSLRALKEYQLKISVSNEIKKYNSALCTFERTHLILPDTASLRDRMILMFHNKQP